MTDAATMRAWLRDHGYEVGAKGGLPASMIKAYEDAHNGGQIPGQKTLDGFDDADFIDEPEPELPGEPEQHETAPKKPRPGPPAGKRAGWRLGKPRAKGKSKARRPRVPVDELIGGAWRLLARLATPMPPLHRTLRVQAPVAGLILEDAVKGTVVDTLLQPVARLQTQGKTVAALVGPPMLVTIGTLHMQRAAIEQTPPNPVLMGFIQEALRESLMLWMSVAGPKFSEALKREQEFEEQYGADVDSFIAFLFAPPPSPDDADAVRAEEEAIRRAQGIL